MSYTALPVKKQSLSTISLPKLEPMNASQRHSVEPQRPSIQKIDSKSAVTLPLIAQNKRH
ncbi:MAG: hypothetical protein HAW62_00430 [Endozoicomonadaceae bacterium]|nr:hypothetical protein [Endozoicomonadaceae bacterium]